MLSIIIPTHDSERPLVHTLAALVSGAIAGLVREVIVTDGRSRDQTEQVADIAGCAFSSSSEPLGARLKAAAAGARGEWLMFVRPGAVPAPSWIDETVAFIQYGPGKAAVFSGKSGGLMGWAHRLLPTLPRPGQGLVIAKSLYAELGGHRAEAPDPERDLLGRLGRSRLTTLRTTITDNI
jgi:cellulose synthase/poly-beta-1,6-N-acetylglucosamine synthase-like glycosyltransferase